MWPLTKEQKGIGKLDNGFTNGGKVNLRLSREAQGK